MVIIYFDESGDLGFDKHKSKSSKYFVITCLITSDGGVANKIIKKAFRKIKGNKKDVYNKLHNKKHELYNYISNIILDRILQSKLIDVKEPIALIASRRETNRYLNKNFHQYLSKSIQDNHGIPITIEIKPHTKDTGLQVVDFISWSIFRKGLPQNMV